MSKITMQDIADALQISRVTVWKTLNNREGVSQELRLQIIQKAKELGYTKLPAESLQIVPQRRRTVSLIVSHPETSIFWMNIVHQIAKELSKNDIDLIYTYLPSTYTKGYTLPATLHNSTIDGCIILNVYEPTLTRMINELPFPKVFLDISTSVSCLEVHGDLIILEGCETVQCLVEELIDSGYTRFGFIGDISRTRTNVLRYEGFAAAMRSRRIPIDPAYCMLSLQDISNVENEVQAFLDSLKTLPEVFVCVNDYTAYLVDLYLTGHGYSVPGDIILTGYDGTAEHDSHYSMYATVQVDTTALGQRLARQLMFRLDAPSCSKEVIYFFSEIIHPSTATASKPGK